MPAWLEQLNLYRALGGLPPVTEDPALSAADQALAEYEVKNLSATSHLNDQPNNPNYRAAQSSNLWSSQDPNAPDSQPLQDWMNGVFHGIQFLDPRLKTVGFGSYRTTANTPGLKMVAALNTIQGLTGAPNYPVLWPTARVTLGPELTTYREEIPEARPSPQPSGQPLFILLGPEWTKVYRVQLDGAGGGVGGAVPFWRLDGSNFTHPDANLQSLGRSILADRGAVVLLPQAPLAIGTYALGYSVSKSDGSKSQVVFFKVGTSTSLSF